MQPVVDQGGTIVAWLKDSVEVFTADGIPVASVPVGYGMYSLDGEFRGFCHKGLFRDKNGRIVARIGNAVAMTTWPALQEFLVRVPSDRRPPVVAFQNDWSADWRSVLAVPDQRKPAVCLTPPAVSPLTESGSVAASRSL